MDTYTVIPVIKNGKPTGSQLLVRNGQFIVGDLYLEEKQLEEFVKILQSASNSNESINQLP